MLWAPERDDPPEFFRFQVGDDQGVTVITDGLAQVRPGGDKREAR